MPDQRLEQSTFSFKLSFIFRDLLRTSNTVEMLVAGASIVGRYPMLSLLNSVSSVERMLNPVYSQTVCFSAA